MYKRNHRTRETNERKRTRTHTQTQSLLLASFHGASLLGEETQAKQTHTHTHIHIYTCIHLVDLFGADVR